MNDEMDLEPSAIAHRENKAGNGTSASRTWLRVCSCLGAAAALPWAQSARAVTVTLVSQGQFPSGKILQIVSVVMNPGERFPWHYHTGTAWVTVVSGTLTDDAGCGTPLVTHTAGSVTTEPAGHVHRLFNFGSEPPCSRERSFSRVATRTTAPSLSGAQVAKVPAGIQKRSQSRTATNRMIRPDGASAAGGSSAPSAARATFPLNQPVPRRSEDGAS